jgi:hypothetical protein
VCGEGSEEGGEEEAGKAEGEEGVYVGQAVEGWWCAVRFGRLACRLRACGLVSYGCLLRAPDIILSSATSRPLLVLFSAVPDASCVYVSRCCH